MGVVLRAGMDGEAFFFTGRDLKKLGWGWEVPVQANLGGASLKTFSRGCQFKKSPCMFYCDKLSILTEKKQNTLREPFYALFFSHDTLLLTRCWNEELCGRISFVTDCILWEPEKDISQAEVKVGNYLFDLQLLLEKIFLLFIMPPTTPRLGLTFLSWSLVAFPPP